MILEVLNSIRRLAKKQLLYHWRMFRLPSEKLSSDGGSFFLPKQYRSRMVVRFDDHSKIAKSGVVWQPDVYKLATFMAKTLKARYIVDIGCGHGEKLASLGNNFEIIGLDTVDNANWCSDNYDFGTWMGVDLEKGFPQLPADAVGNAILVCSDVIEHIYDARKFATGISEMLESCHIGVISTPDRGLLHPPGHIGPPLNPKHIREWKPAEFQAFLESCGMEVWVGLTRTNTASDSMQTIIAVASKG